MPRDCDGGVSSSPLPYRPDIDGLRGLAIVLVICWHYGVPIVAGGFIGVDVFFVISGYLITSIVSLHMQRGTFGLSRFYEARLRRIGPALVAMLAVTFLIALLELGPQDLKAFAKGVFASLFSASNVEFYRVALSYFDPPEVQKPLLHTWSLGVEGQFYLLFPLLMLHIGDNRRRRVIVIGALCAGSFALSAWQTAYSPLAGFYLLPSRLWELLLGALVALKGAQGIGNPLWRNLAALLGIAAIAGAAICYTQHTPFPGVAVLPPCLGTAVFIWAGTKERAFVNRLLSGRLPLALGLISYSLYLWHWPVLVFASYFEITAPSNLGKLGLMGLVLIVSVLSYRYIERPFRGSHGILSRRALFSRPSQYPRCSVCLPSACLQRTACPADTQPKFERWC